MEAYIISVITTNHMEPTHYGSYESKTLRGIYTCKEKKDKFVKELKASIVSFEEENKSLHFIKQTVEEETIILNQPF